MTGTQTESSSGLIRLGGRGVRRRSAGGRCRGRLGGLVGRRRWAGRGRVCRGVGRRRAGAWCRGGVRCRYDDRGGRRCRVQAAHDGGRGRTCLWGGCRDGGGGVCRAVRARARVRVRAGVGVRGGLRFRCAEAGDFGVGGQAYEAECAGRQGQAAGSQEDLAGSAAAVAAAGSEEAAGGLPVLTDRHGFRRCFRRPAHHDPSQPARAPDAPWFAHVMRCRCR